MRRQRWKWLLPVWVSAAYWVFSANAQAVELGSGDVYLLENSIEVLQDPETQFTFEEILNKSTEFQLSRPFPALGYTRDVVWFRIPLKRPQSIRSDWILKISPSYLDHVDFWLEQGGTVVASESIGRRDYSEVGYILPDALQTHLDIPEGHSTLYLRVRTGTTLAILPALMAPDAFLIQSERNSFRIGLVIGAMLLVFVFNLLGWWITRVGLYGLFAGYVGFGAFSILEGAGLISSFFWSEWQLLTSRPLSISLGFSWLFAYMFFMQLLVDKKKEWWLLPLYYLLFAFAIAQIFAGVIGGNAYSYVTEVMVPVGIVVTGLTMVSALRLILKGESGSQKLLGVAYLPHALLLIPNQLFTGGWLSPSLFSIFSQTQGGILQIAVLQVVLMYRVKDVLQERNRALEDATRVNAEVERERKIREEQSRFLAMITHEIRTPLAVVDMSVQSLKAMDQNPDSFHKTRYSRIQSAVKRMATLLELGLKKDGLNGEIWQPDAQVDLVTLSQKVISEFPVDQHERIQWDGTVQAAFILGNQAALKLTCFNLIENALKYSDDKAVLVSAGESDNGFYWQVDDQGQGIPQEQRGKIFEKFFRAGEHSGKPGLGLGLYIAQQIIERHKGRIACLPSRLGGACFRCEFDKGR
ncbi:sensor histidine kinase [Sansalvadorimonas verongulae]|uniref:sensor histidine kinase n=1 Tax=Sansalvadorimonas verongulae TaxID=2172824 RepID=UPI0012BBA7AE|nr:sensor histidine kinase [Sansalvadorimonas verongulae]MTI12537.1 hypothetical protein [Sansalvadorimonas verongulae]